MLQCEVLRERLKRFSGQYECHISVSMPKNAFASFRRVCESLNAKALTIHLADGESAIQPMLCKRYSVGAEASYKDITYMARQLSKRFEVSRVKVEAALTNSNIPTARFHCASLPSDCYFEHHVKINFTAGEDLGFLKAQLKNYAGYLSRNPYTKSDKLESRFVTQRFYRCTQQQAEDRLGQLIEFLNNKHYQMVKVIREFNIYDSNARLDRGWMHNVGEQ